MIYTNPEAISNRTGYFVLYVFSLHIIARGGKKKKKNYVIINNVIPVKR